VIKNKARSELSGRAFYFMKTIVMDKKFIDEHDNLENSNPWKKISSEVKYENPWISLTEYKVVTPAGTNGIYGKVHFKNIAIGVIAIDSDENTYLVGQYRFPLDLYSWEIPEGGCPEGTDWLAAAKRELKEETGFEAGKWTEILQMHVSNSVSDELAVVYVAQDLIAGKAEPEDTEDLKIIKMPFKQAVDWVMQGKITDSISVAAILKWSFMKAL
jgi:8-oxo-dGTP pyrophosphatase MutT (NUDIX family)